jgi:hypothetical protein
MLRRGCGPGRRGRGRGGEGRHAAHEQPLAAEDVGKAAAEQQQAAERQGVRRDDPLAVRIREVQRGLRVRQSDAHDRRVESNHQLCGSQDGKDPPLALSPGCSVGGLGHRGSLVRAGHFFYVCKNYMHCKIQSR